MRKQRGVIGLVIFLVISVLIIAIAGMWYFRKWIFINPVVPRPNYGNQIQLESPSASASATPVASSSANTINPTNWKTYSNEQYNFKLLYPNDWNIKSSNDSYDSYSGLQNQLQEISFDGQFCNLSVIQNPQNLSLQQWVNNVSFNTPAGQSLIMSKRNTTLGDISAEAVEVFGFDKTDLYTYGAHKNFIYRFYMPEMKGNANFTTDQQATQDTCGKIASSIQFL